MALSSSARRRSSSCPATPERQALAKAFGATHIVEERGEEGIAKVMELTDGVGAHGVAEAVGTQQSSTRHSAAYATAATSVS